MLYAAKESTALRTAILKALVAAPTWFPSLPRFSDRELVNTIRIVNLRVTETISDASKSNEWKRIRGRLVDLLRCQVRPPLLRENAVEAGKVLKAAADFLQIAPRFLEKELPSLEDQFDILKRFEVSLSTQGIPSAVRVKMIGNAKQSLLGKGARNPRRGRRFAEHELRKLAAVMLLFQYGDSKEEARRQVVGCLSEWGEHVETDSLKALETRYRHTSNPRKMSEVLGIEKCKEAGIDPDSVTSTTGRADAFIPLEKLPRYWLNHLGQFFLWGQKLEYRQGFCSGLFSPQLESQWRHQAQRFKKTNRGSSQSEQRGAEE